MQPVGLPKDSGAMWAVTLCTVVQPGAQFRAGAHRAVWSLILACGAGQRQCGAMAPQSPYMEPGRGAAGPCSPDPSIQGWAEVAWGART